MVTIAIVNPKGGVGKTTITFNLAKWFSLCGKKVLAVDNDPQANLTSSFVACRSECTPSLLDVYEGRPAVPQEISDNLFLIGSDVTLATVAERPFEVVFRLRDLLKDLSNRRDSSPFDYLLIDSLPSIGYLHLAALAAADYALIPVTPSPYALMGLNQLFLTIRKAQRHLNPMLKILGLVLNLVDGRRLRLERKIESVLRASYGPLVFGSKLSKRVPFAESPSFNKGIFEYHPGAASSREFGSFAVEIIKRMGVHGKVSAWQACSVNDQREPLKTWSRARDERGLGSKSPINRSYQRAEPAGAAGERRRLKDLENMDLIFVRSIYRANSVPNGVP